LKNKNQKILVTSALPYANGPLHLGHLAGAYLPADIYVRYNRLKKRDVIYICGTDEHGVPITITAEKEGVHPKELVDRYHKIIKESFQKLGMSFDNFSQTSLKIHYETSQEFFLKLYNNKEGYFREKAVKQFYCETDKMFLADRYVEGTCPICGNPNARGDQCEKCGSWLEQTELKNPRCKVCGNPPIIKDTFHLFLALDKFQDKLKKWIDSKTQWKDNVKNYCYGWLNEGLKDRAITRDLNWGIPVPLEKYKDKVIYVWFEAPIGYISSTKEWAQKTGQLDKWKDYWLDKNTKLIHFIGKDNIVFHALIFPAMLMAYEDYVLPDNVPANEFLNLDGEKFSTSRNYAVWIHEYLEKFPPDPLRYYLSAIAPETKDSDFVWKDFQTRNNSELADILGNFINRTLTFIEKNFDSAIPEPSDFDELDYLMRNKTISSPHEIGNALENFQVKESIKLFMDVARFANKYFNDKEPWKTKNENPDKCKTTMFVCAKTIETLAVLMHPFMPFSSEKLWKILNLSGKIEEQEWDNAGKKIQAGHKIRKSEILFTKIENDVIEKEIEKLRRASIPKPTQKQDTGLPLSEAKGYKIQDTGIITIDDFKKIDLRIAEIMSAEKVPKSDKLLKIQVKVGNETRQIVAGIAKYYEPEKLIGKKVVVVFNLAPAKLFGIESQGMLLAGSNENKLTIITVESDIESGVKIK
jgi:methionyl-tRNA synthetase